MVRYFLERPAGGVGHDVVVTGDDLVGNLDGFHQALLRLLDIVAAALHPPLLEVLHGGNRVAGNESGPASGKKQAAGAGAEAGQGKEIDRRGDAIGSDLAPLQRGEVLLEKPSNRIVLTFAQHLEKACAYRVPFGFADQPAGMLERANAAAVGRAEIGQEDVGHVGRFEPRPLDEAGGEIHDQYLDSSRSRNELGWSVSVGLEAGLERTFDWYSDLLAN